MFNTQVIAIGNQKGGVAKTTTCVQLAAALGELGKTSLVFDLDSNSGSSKHFGVVEDAKFHGTFEVLTGEAALEDVIVTEEDEDLHLPKGVHLVPARRNLEQVENELRRKDPYFVPHQMLNAPLEQLRGRYDYIFLDTAPHTVLATTISSYASADWFVLSTFPEQFGMDGIRDAISDIARAQQRVNPNLKLLGVVLSAVAGRTRMSRAISEYLARQVMPNINIPLKFDTNISRSVVVTEAQQARKTVLQFNGSHPVAEQYRALAREVEARIAAISAAIKDAAKTKAAEEQDTDSEKAVANG